VMSLVIRVLAIAMTLAVVNGCASVTGYQKAPESTSVTEARRTKYYGAAADAVYYSAGTGARQAIRDELVYGKMQVLEDDFLDFERSLNSAGNYVSLGSCPANTSHISAGA
jgi:uncharacterized protein YceK